MRLGKKYEDLRGTPPTVNSNGKGIQKWKKEDGIEKEIPKYSRERNDDKSQARLVWPLTFDFFYILAAWFARGKALQIEKWCYYWIFFGRR